MGGGVNDRCQSISIGPKKYGSRCSPPPRREETGLRREDDGGWGSRLKDEGGRAKHSRHRRRKNFRCRLPAFGGERSIASRTLRDAAGHGHLVSGRCHILGPARCRDPLQCHDSAVYRFSPSPPNVRFRPERGHPRAVAPCRRRAKAGQSHSTTCGPGNFHVPFRISTRGR